MAAAIIAYGAASALGVGEHAFDVGPPGQRPPNVWSSRGAQPDKAFARVTACSAERAHRPTALLELGFRQVLSALETRVPSFREQRLGVVIGTSSGGFAALERALAQPDDSSPNRWAETAYFSALSSVLGLLERRPQRLVALYAACASSALAIGLGLRWLELDEVDLVIAGGYDAESDWVGAGFDALKATSRGQPRPFTAQRDGMALGEGVGLLALSRETRGALGYVSGFGATTDAVHITAPDRFGQGLARAATRALEDAGAATSEVDFVSVHGTGTSFNDAAEAAALRAVFGPAAEGLRLHAFKSVIGHTLGAAAALEALAALSALERGVIPASASVGTPMPELPVALLDTNAAAPVERCLKLATAFGGANAALLLSRQGFPGTARARRAVHLVAAGELCRELDVARLMPVLTASLERLPRSDALSEVAVAAGGEALRAAAALGIELSASRTGVVVGSVSSSLEADAQFGARILLRGPEHAEPRRFPATSPNAAAGHVAIAFGLGGPSHAVGASALAALEALEVARDWVASGDAETMLVVAAEQLGATACRALEAEGVALPVPGAFALLLSSTPRGPLLDQDLLKAARERANAPKSPGFSWLIDWCARAGLPGPSAFGSVRPPE